MKTRKIQDYTTIQIPGKNSWENAKKNIWNMFYKGYLDDSKFVIEVSNTRNSPGIYSVVNTREKLSNIIEFVEKNHVKEERLFNFHFHNLYLNEFYEKEYPIKENSMEKYLLEI